MRKYLPEFAAVPIVIVGLGLLSVILFASHSGLVAWLAVGAVILVALVAAAAVAMRRPRSTSAPDRTDRASVVDDGVHRVLLVVDDACREADLEALAAGRGERATEVLVVAPAVSSRVARWTGDEHAYEQAEEHLDATLRALAGLGCDARGHVGPHDPLQAADDGLREFRADELVFVLAGGDEAAWLEQQVVDLASARFAVPVRRLEAAPHGG